MKHVRYALLAVVVPAFVVPLLTLQGCSKPAPTQPPIRSVRTLMVDVSNAQSVIEFAGEVRARTETRLGFRVPGKLANRAVNLGDEVKAGQVLATLDPTDIQLGQASAQAALSSAKANQEQLEADFRRFKDLRDQGFISAAEFDRRQLALTAARAQFDQARAQASLQQNQAAYTRLVADASGVVTGVDAEPGAVLTAGSSVVRVALDGPRDVWFSVPEDRVSAFRGLARVKEASGVFVRLWGDSTERPARIREVAGAADPVTRTFLVKAVLDSAAGAGVQLGQTATVRLAQGQAQGLIRLPLSAVGEQQGRSVVWVVDTRALTVSPQPIEVAGADGNAVVVRSGIAPGQTIVTAGIHVLSPGQQVRLYVEPKKPGQSMGSLPAPVGVPGVASGPAR